VKRRSLVETGAQDEHMPPMPDGKRVSVAILSGPDSGKVLQCSVSRAVIGRTGSDLPIQDDEISRRHAVVETRDDRYFLKDLRSTNGTFVDERRITEVEIFDRSEFRVGTTTCMLIVAARDEL
jgi:S-DNA-T family DNA segregation ATPase FtsK/SpoIIIE